MSVKAISTPTEVPIYPWNLQFSTPLDLTNVKVTKLTDAPIHPWDLQQSSTLLELTNGKVVTTPTVIPIYPWDLQPFSTPVALAISSPSSQTFSSSLSTFQPETATIQPSISSDIPTDIKSKFQTFLRTIPTITTASTASLPYVPSSSSATNDDLNFIPSLLEPGIDSIQPSIPPNFQHDVKSTFLTSLRPSTTTIATSIISLESVHSASQQTAAISSFVNTSNISAAVQSTTPISCNGRANREATFTIDVYPLHHDLGAQAYLI